MIVKWPDDCNVNSNFWLDERPVWTENLRAYPLSRRQPQRRLGSGVRKTLQHRGIPVKKLSHHLLVYLGLVLVAVFLLRATKPTWGNSPLQARAGKSELNPVARQHQLASQYGQLPLSFEANRGQTDARVRFLARGTGYSLFLTGSEAVLALRSAPSASPLSLLRASSDGAGSLPATERLTSLRLKLLGANPQSDVTGMSELPGKTNYFLGNDPKKWRTNVPTYARVKYHDIYPGVDLLYYGNQRQLEYDFVVAPGADPGQIGLDVNGARGLRIDAQGDLVAQTDAGEVTFHKPVMYQREDQGDPLPTPREAEKHFVDGRYILRDRHEIGFVAASYDRNKPLVIDPVLTYSTFLGGSSFDAGTGIAVDSSGNAYVTGGTISADFPTTPGADQTAYGGTAPHCGGNAAPYICGDVFVTKMNPTGTALVYSTFLGGSDADFGLQIAVDSSGAAYVTGSTASSNFPVTSGVFQPAFGGGACGSSGGRPCHDAFVTKLDPTGAKLVYSSFLGGNGNDEGFGIAVDAFGDAFVTGQTNSANFPTTPLSKFPSQIGGTCSNGTAMFTCDDAFVAEVNPAATALVYSTYLGGHGDDFGISVALDFAGDAFVVGATASTDFPATAGALQTTFGGGTTPTCSSSICGDGFVAMLDPTGSTLLYATYVGGSGDDTAVGVAVDSSANIYVTGVTDSSNFPTTPGAAQTLFGGGSSSCANRLLTCGDAFALKIQPPGSALTYSTFIGGSGDDGAFSSAAVDPSGDFYVGGATNSLNFPLAGATQSAFGGGSPNCNAANFPCGDAFVTEVNPTGSALVFSTYLGGSGDDGAAGVAVDPLGAIYVTGITGSANFPTTAGVFQSTCGGGCSGTTDAFVTKFSLSGANAAFAAGDVFAAVGNGGIPAATGKVNVYAPDGSLIRILDTGISCPVGTCFTAGMAFDKANNLYVTDFSSANVTEFDKNGNLIGSFGSGYTGGPESIVFNSVGDVLVGAAQAPPAPPPPPVPVFEFGPSGNLVNTFMVAPENRGSDWIDLAADQKTLLYTSEGKNVFSFNIATNTQNPNFVTGLPGTIGVAYALRILPDQTVLVADSDTVVHLNNTGSVITTYTLPGNPTGLFALSLDPNGTDFWTSDLNSGDAVFGTIWEVNIATGAVDKTINTGLNPIGGLVVFGQVTVASNPLTVTEAGTGTGTVTSNPTGINCPTACSTGFALGTMVTLTEAPAAGSTFAGWSVAGCPGTTSTCTVTMNSPQSVTATFNAVTTNFTLTVTEAGTGSGTVTGPGGINCPGTCSASFASGTVVNLTETAATGSAFAGWSGACTGMGACSVTMNSNQSVTATFNTTATNFTLTVAEAGTGSGTVTGPGGVNCPGTCSASFASGTVVNLTATAATGSTFAGWSGACSGASTTCTVTMNSAQSVTATFNVNGGTNFTLSPASGGGTTATVHPGDTAVFPLTLTPVNGFTGPVTLSCASQQPTITCSISPTTVNLVAGGTAAAIAVDTFCAWMGPRFAPPYGIPGPWLPALAALMALALTVAVTGLSRRKLRPAFAVAALALFAMLGAGCASVPHGPAGATPPGTYNLVVTASEPRSAPQTILLTLKVI
jgi:hypothetical protein